MREFNPDMVRKYMNRNYVGDHMVMAAAGNVDHDGLVQVAENALRISSPMVPQRHSAPNITAARNAGFRPRTGPYSHRL